MVNRQHQYITKSTKEREPLLSSVFYSDTITDTRREKEGRLCLPFGTWTARLVTAIIHWAADQFCGCNAVITACLNHNLDRCNLEYTHRKKPFFILANLSLLPPCECLHVWFSDYCSPGSWKQHLAKQLAHVFLCPSQEAWGNVLANHMTSTWFHLP